MQTIFGVIVASGDDSAELVPVDHRTGVLRNLMDPDPPRLEPDEGFYALGVLPGESDQADART